MTKHVFSRSGGKSRIAQKIIAQFPYDYPTHVYVEPLLGAGWVWLHKRPSEFELLNDKDKVLYNAWLCLQKHGKELSGLFQEQIKHECVLEEYISDLQEPISPPDITKALKYIVAFKLLRDSRYQPDTRPQMRLAIMKMSLSNLKNEARKLAARLENVWLYCQDANDFISKVLNLEITRGRRVLFYLDTVYPDTSNNYYDLSTGNQLDFEWKTARLNCDRIHERGHLFYMTVNANDETLDFASKYSHIVIREVKKGNIGSEILVSNAPLFEQERLI